MPKLVLNGSVHFVTILCTDHGHQSMVIFVLLCLQYTHSTPTSHMEITAASDLRVFVTSGGVNILSLQSPLSRVAPKPYIQLSAFAATPVVNMEAALASLFAALYAESIYISCFR